MPNECREGHAEETVGGSEFNKGRMRWRIALVNCAMRLFQFHFVPADDCRHQPYLILDLEILALMQGRWRYQK